MYRLEFRENKSKYFNDALAFSLDLGGAFQNGIVVLELPEERLLDAYRTMRTLFGFIQNWKGTVAYFQGKEVHPYQFILHAHRISECADMRTDDIKHCHINMDTFGWGCKKIDFISYNLNGNGMYRDNRRYWYNYGHFNNSGRWIIDKELIKTRLVQFGREKALYLCPFYDELNIARAVDQLPDYIVPDNVTFKVHFAETYSKGERLEIPSNIRHITERNYSDSRILGILNI